MKYEAKNAPHEKMQKPFLVIPDNPTNKQDKAIKELRKRHPELEAK